LWILPLCGCIIGVLVAQLFLWIDRTVHIKTLMHYSSGTATGVLTAIIGAMVALLGFVVTIGVLVIQQATATLSPRLCGCGTATSCKRSYPQPLPECLVIRLRYFAPHRHEFCPRSWRYHCRNCRSG